ncbi:helix-turn-helix domain-containing protein [Actinoplanes sp. NPDC049596]|uniref:TetR/AcrR family transcriptional regulator n=1 Tax=unclassified Actinoplanes TaxID=2626549 RepID=UPI00343B5EC6
MQRADARANRSQIVEAARDTFAAHGLDAPMRSVAQRAGIGVATLYRHFPTRTDLVRTVLADRVEACTRRVQAALADPDPWRALAATVLDFADSQIRYRALNEALLNSFAPERRAHAAALDTLVARATAAGTLRPGVDSGDVRAGLVALAALRNRPPQLITKLADLVLAGLKAPSPLA